MDGLADGGCVDVSIAKVEVGGLKHNGAILQVGFKGLCTNLVAGNSGKVCSAMSHCEVVGLVIPIHHHKSCLGELKVKYDVKCHRPIIVHRHQPGEVNRAGDVHKT
jgi:hypothetical protein